ncbi:alpha/beta fold hydrolase [Gordonia rubripertincta]|uniref:Alpha/beta fold hydrolase n=2 Tax=Gordonia rubripertincta TaxID=36822 RepID=A0AAW4G273_GORRU|nr:alpha/beta fold hydrolase [Gordonia rubripertincta]MBM7277200.1 alpha/beta fold hydrolase [Gordonia rubripertincta]MDG6780446.1 alpha/beta fold hydrolase [Gordonia rubripertincta]NKY64167.1 alpha/beta fold hydrolase [Gordonia rubripertincta]GAB83404.1 putative hydrolase [Gordonia rubripertincta NBRC 101908]
MSTDVSYEGTRRELETSLGVLRYHEAGDGPPLLLLHGSGPGVTGWRNYRGVLADLAEHFRCLVLEFPGFGVSDPGDGHPMVMAQTSVGLFLDGLGLGAVNMIGNSMGGIVAARVAIDEPHRVSKLVTIGGMGKNVLSSGPSEGIKLLMEFTDDPTRDRLVRWLTSMVHDPALVTEELIAERWELATDPTTLDIARRMYGSKAFAATMAAAAASDAPPYWSRLNRITAPTLLTWGRDDRVSPVDMALLPMRDIPDAELHVFPRCGHWTMIEAREAWLSAVLAFLTRTDRTA